MAKIPVIITNFNLYTWPKAMVKKLMRMPGVGPILIVDNDSTYGPTLEWYEQLKLEANEVAVIRTGGNFGHLVAWQAQIPQQLFDMGYPDYIVTDPDLDLSALPDDTLLRMRELWYDLPEKTYMYEQEEGDPFNGVKFSVKDKIGLGIRTDDIPADALFFQQAELRYKNQPYFHDLQLAPVDTTFAFYHHQRYQRVVIGGARMVAPYECRHLPYYLTADDLNADWEFGSTLTKPTTPAPPRRLRTGLKSFDHATILQRHPNRRNSSNNRAGNRLTGWTRCEGDCRPFRVKFRVGLRTKPKPSGLHRSSLPQLQPGPQSHL